MNIHWDSVDLLDCDWLNLAHVIHTIHFNSILTKESYLIHVHLTRTTNLQLPKSKFNCSINSGSSNDSLHWQKKVLIKFSSAGKKARNLKCSTIVGGTEIPRSKIEFDWELQEPPRCNLWYNNFNNLYENQLFEIRISKLAKQTTFKSVIKSYLSLTNKIRFANKIRFTHMAKITCNR